MTYGNYPDLNGVKKVLVVKLRQLGDVLLTTPVFENLKKNLRAEVHAYVYQEAKELLDSNPFIDQMILYDRTWKKKGLFFRLKQEIALWKKIRKEKYDLVINLTEGDRGTFAAKISKAKIRVGFPPKGKWQKKLYTHVAKICPGLRHTVERNLDVLRRIGIFPEPEDRELFLNVEQDAKLFAGQFGSFVLIHPTSRWRFKCWPTSKMRQLAEFFISDGKQIVFTSGPDPVEKEMVNQITQGLDVINLSGKVNLKQLAGLIEACQMLICVDSLPFHMASALKKPVVGIFGPTSDITWGPWRNGSARIVKQDLSCRPCYQDGCGGSKLSDCLATLPVKQVLLAIESLETMNLVR